MRKKDFPLPGEVSICIGTMEKTAGYPGLSGKTFDQALVDGGSPGHTVEEWS